MAGVLNLHKGFVFIHVPRCAGSSLTAVLAKLPHSIKFGDMPGLGRVVETENARSAETVELALHARARDIRRLLGPNMYRRLESFAVVRNPWDRLKSRYHYIRAMPGHSSHPYTQGSLSEFVEWSCTSRPATMQERLTDEQGQLIVNNILRFETLHSDLSDFFKTHISEAGELPHINRSSNARHPARFEDHVIGLVQRTYARDFALFGYASEPPEDGVQ